MFDKETIIVKSPNGISTKGLVEWLGQRSDADDLEVQSIVYRRGAHSPDEYLPVEPGITAGDMFWWEGNGFTPDDIVIDYCVTFRQKFSPYSTHDADKAWIGSADEYVADLDHEAQDRNYDTPSCVWADVLDYDLGTYRVVKGVLTGDLFNGQCYVPVKGDGQC